MRLWSTIAAVTFLVTSAVAVPYSGLLNRCGSTQGAAAKWFKGHALKLIPSHVHNIEC